MKDRKIEAEEKDSQFSKGASNTESLNKLKENAEATGALENVKSTNFDMEDTNLLSVEEEKRKQDWQEEDSEEEKITSERKDGFPKNFAEEE